MTKYTIAEARHNLAAIVHELEDNEQIELTRRGEPVAVLLSMNAYRRLATPRKDFWEAYQTWHQALVKAEIDIEPEVLAGGRDRSPGRDVNL